MSSSTFFALAFIFLMARRGGLLRLLVVLFGCACILTGCVPAFGQSLPSSDGIASVSLGPLTLSSTSATGVFLRGPQALAVSVFDPTKPGGCDSVRVRVFLSGPTTGSSRSAVRQPLDTPQTVSLQPVVLSEAGRYECLVVAVFYPRGNQAGVAAARTFYVDNAGTPLPVRLSSFTLTGSAAALRLAWTSATELRLEYYEAQMSCDGQTWATVGRVAPHGAGSYELTLAAPVGLSYYRLRVVDLDQSVSYSAVRTWAGAAAAAQLLEVAGQRLPFALRAGEVPDLLTVYDYTGRRQWAGVVAGAAALVLPAGIYIVVLSTAQGGRYVSRFSQP